MSGALGDPYKGEAEKTQTAFDKIIEVALKHGKYIFFSTRYPGLGMEMARKGCHIVHIGNELLAAVSYQEQLVTDMRKTKIEKGNR